MHYSFTTEVSFDSYHMVLQDKHVHTSAHVCMNAEMSNPQLYPSHFSAEENTEFIVFQSHSGKLIILSWKPGN